MATWCLTCAWVGRARGDLVPHLRLGREGSWRPGAGSVMVMNALATAPSEEEARRELLELLANRA